MSRSWRASAGEGTAENVILRMLPGLAGHRLHRPAQVGVGGDVVEALPDGPVGPDDEHPRLPQVAAVPGRDPLLRRRVHDLVLEVLPDLEVHEVDAVAELAR